MSNILQTLWHQQEIMWSQMQVEVWTKAKLASGNFLWLRVEWDGAKNLGPKKPVCKKNPVSLEGAYMKVYVLISNIACKLILQGWVLEKQILSFRSCWKKIVVFFKKTCYQSCSSTDCHVHVQHVLVLQFFHLSGENFIPHLTIFVNCHYHSIWHHVRIVKENLYFEYHTQKLVLSDVDNLAWILHSLPYPNHMFSQTSVCGALNIMA